MLLLPTNAQTRRQTTNAIIISEIVFVNVNWKAIGIINIQHIIENIIEINSIERTLNVQKNTVCGIEYIVPIYYRINSIYESYSRKVIFAK